MKQKSIYIMLCFFLLFFTVEQGFAADDNLYQVELIVFKLNASQGPNISKWQVYNPLPMQNIIELQQPNDEIKTFTLLSQKRLILSKEAWALKRSGRYEILMHWAWIQPLTSREDTKPIHIYGGKQYDNDSQDWQLDGTITVSQHNYINFKANVNLVEPYGGTLKRFPLIERRKMKDLQLNYLDGPVFGILVKLKQVGVN